MLNLKVVKRGNSLALSLPKDSNFKLNENWIAIPKEHGKGYTLVPRIDDPYKDAKPGEFYVGEEWAGFNESDVD